jgi:glyoxylase-like metal-dependent hydrolase (beta-lactamase superfamily II)
MSRSILAPLAIAALAPLGGCDLDDLLSMPPEVQSYTSGAEGFDTTTWWVDTGAEVVVFDAQFTPDIARDMLAEIRANTSNPIRYVVVTHPNPDKFNGAAVFQAAGAQLVTSRATADAMPGVHAYKEAYFVGAGMFAEGEYPALPEVDITFSGELELELNGLVDVTLVELENPGVSSTQTVAVMDSALVVGDLVAGRAHAWLEGGIVDGAPQIDLGAWIDALDELRDLEAGDAIVYPGRGKALPMSEVVPAQQAYLAELGEIVAGYVGGLEDPAAALTGDEAWGHYEAITAEAEAAFPGYSLSYLVTYGVYGLALTEAGVF